MQNEYNPPPFGFGMLFSQSLALQEYYDSLTKETEQGRKQRVELQTGDENRDANYTAKND